MAVERIIEGIQPPVSAVTTGMQPLVDTFQPLFYKITLVLGGIAGLYLLMVLVRIYYERRKVKILQDIRYDLDHLNLYYEIPCSWQKKGFFRKLIDFFKSPFKKETEEGPPTKKHKK